MGSATQTEEISLELMQRGGMLVMVGGAAAIIGCILGIISESKLIAFVMAIGATLGFWSFVIGLIVWMSGWMLRED